MANDDGGGSTSSPYQEPVNLETRPLQQTSASNDRREGEDIDDDVDEHQQMAMMLQ